MNEKFTIFFGDKNNCTVSHKSKEFESFCDKLAQEHGLTKLIFQKQVHGTAGTYIDSKEKAERIKPFDLEGDFLITNQKNIGIGVLTADCLPIIFYDTKNHVAACIHAGWRSSVGEIVAKAVQMMFEKFKFAPEDLQIYFGPCAKTCCYQVQPDFLDNLKNFKFKNQVIRKDGAKLFFDNVLFNKLLLIDLGMLCRNMHFENNECTMCTELPGAGKSDSLKFHSFRRGGDPSTLELRRTSPSTSELQQAERASRQISFISLK